MLGLLVFAPLVSAQQKVSSSATSPSPDSPPPSDTATAGRPTPIPDDVEKVLWWLPDDTEAVVVSRGNVPVPKPTSPPPPTNLPAAPRLASPKYALGTKQYDIQDLLAKYCIEPLVYFQPLFTGDTRDELQNSIYGPQTASLFVKAVWWAEGAPRQTCDIVLFRDETAGRILESLSAFPHASQRINDVKVLELNLYDTSSAGSPRVPIDAEGKPPVDRRWLAAPRPNIYLCTTSLELLKIMIDRIERRGANRAFPPTLPHWRQLDPSSKAWGMRRYRAATSGGDSLSMLKRDPNAEGLVFFGESTPSPAIVLRYLSRTNDAGSRFQQMQRTWLERFPNAAGFVANFAESKQVASGCWESRIRINVPLEELDENPFINLSVDATWFFAVDRMFLPWLGFAQPRSAFGSN